MSENLSPDMYNQAMPYLEAQEWSLFDNPEFIDFIGPEFPFHDPATGIE